MGNVQTKRKPQAHASNEWFLFKRVYDHEPWEHKKNNFNRIASSETTTSTNNNQKSKKIPNTLFSPFYLCRNISLFLCSAISFFSSRMLNAGDGVSFICL